MTDPQVAMVMMGSFVGSILLGFPICFTLIAMGVGFGYYAYAPSDWMSHPLTNNVFDLLVNQTYSVMINDVLVAVPLFLFMGYIVERANIVGRLFYSLNIAARFIPGAMAVAALMTCAIFATAVGIVGAVVTLMGLLAFPALLKAGYDTKLSAGVVCAGGCLGILIPPSIMLIVYGAVSGVSVVRLYAGALIPGFMLAGLYILYVIGRAALNPKLAPKPPKEDTDIPHSQLFMMLLTSVFPLTILILAVLGSILFGLATPSEAAAVGAFGSIVLAAGYRELTWKRLRDSVYLTVRTSAMVLLAFCRLVDILFCFFLSWRPYGHRGVCARTQPASGSVSADGPSDYFFFLAGRLSGVKLSSSSCRFFCPCWTPLVSIHCSSESLWHSICRPRS